MTSVISGKVEDALKVMEALLRLDVHTQDNVVRHAYEKAVFEVRKSKRLNYYEVRGSADAIHW